MAGNSSYNLDLTLSGTGARYHRISSNKQDFDRQVDAIDRWLASHNLQAVLTFGDTGARDLAEERFQFQVMIQKVISKEVSWVVIQSIDRLGFKDEYELFYFISIFRQHGVQLWSAVDDVCISHSSDAQSVLNLVAGLTSTKEQLEKSNRIQTKRVTKALRGEYLGGIPPYGLDVVCKTPDGRIRFRYILEEGEVNMIGRKPNGRPIYKARLKGLKVSESDPIGEPCDGIPLHDKGDTLFLAPTIRQDRIGTVKRIFLLMDTESTNPTQISALLNSEGVSPVIGKVWTDAKIRPMLSNPVYIGRPAANKKSHPRFYEIGPKQQVQRVKTSGKVTTRRRTRDCWVMPAEPVFPPIVDAERFERVNALIAPKEKRAPRTEKLYLTGLLFCGHCGKLMHGASQRRDMKKRKQDIFYYHCQTRMRYGSSNASGCGFHSTRQEHIEKHIDEFLRSRGQALDSLLSVERDTKPLERLLEEQSKQDSDAVGLLLRMRQFVRDNLGACSNDPDDSLKNHDGVLNHQTLQTVNSAQEPKNNDLASMEIVDVYDVLIAHKVEKLGRRLAALEADHSALADKVAGLTAPKLIERLNQKALELEAQIDAVKAELEPLSDRFMEVHRRLHELRRRIEIAEEKMRVGGFRARAAALRSCISRIDCWYGRTKGGRTFLQRITIIPRDGDPFEITELRNDAMRRRGSGRPNRARSRRGSRAPGR
jgi:predicted site-specific integrase-resolvase